METIQLTSILPLAFGLGLLHALDADHIVAVSGLSSTRPGFRTTLRFCLHWALGHGLTLLLIGAAVLLLGVAIPETLSHVAEIIVGVVLIAIGVWVLADLIRKRAHLHFHHHDDLPDHAHWHRHGSHQAHDEKAHRHDHKAVMVGVLHGTAGSAPLLALLPMAQLPSPLWGLAYLLLFGLGVIISMLAFGGMLGGLFKWLQGRGRSAVYILRTVVAGSAIAFGAWWLAGTA